VDPNRVAIGKEMTETWEYHEYQCDRNDMFLGVDREFLGVLDGAAVKTCAIQDGVKVLKLIEAARQSNTKGQMIDLSSYGI